MLTVLGPAVTTAVLPLIMSLDMTIRLAGSWWLSLLNRLRAWGSIYCLGLVASATNHQPRPMVDLSFP